MSYFLRKERILFRYLMNCFIFIGLFSKLFSWFAESKSSWFYGGWFNDFPSTTTPNPTSSSTGTWFQNFLDSEDVDVSTAASEKC